MIGLGLLLLLKLLLGFLLKLLLKPLSRLRERGWGEGKLLADEARSQKVQKQMPEPKAPLIRPSGTFSRRREKGCFSPSCLTAAAVQFHASSSSSDLLTR
ncbi:hypothetical protein AXG53_16750 [Stenotrophomonas sp. KCTC 12332]|nr:hypothetical protein AXG53_16750 [Stenotrophomonas sp. KCTC 12332]